MPISTCDVNKIIIDLKNKGLKIISATNKLSWRSKKPLDMFVLAFEAGENINNIYEIKDILKFKVAIEPLKNLKLIPQCKKCQGYGHTQNYCEREPRCVKCPGIHLTRDCTKLSSDSPKYVHCGETHPANYRGCLVAKELQKIKDKKVQNSSNVTQNTTGIQKTSSTNQKQGSEKFPSSDSDHLLFSQKASAKPANTENKAIEDLH